MADQQINRFSDKVEQLIQHCSKLESDNAALKLQQDHWHTERATLLQKNDLARNKIEAMIGRLRALEQN